MSDMQRIGVTFLIGLVISVGMFFIKEQPFSKVKTATQSQGHTAFGAHVDTSFGKTFTLKRGTPVSVGDWYGLKLLSVDSSKPLTLYTVYVEDFRTGDRTEVGLEAQRIEVSALGARITFVEGKADAVRLSIAQ